MPCGPPMTGIAGLTPHLAATAGSILISAQSLPGSPAPDVFLATVPTTAIVVVSTCIVTSCPTASVQWRAVRTYFEVPSVKMKLAVQPYGATMQPPAETPGFWTPGHSVLSASSPTLTPTAPLVCSCCLTELVRNFGAGRTGAELDADAVPASDSARTQTSAAQSLVRMKKKPPENWMRARSHARPTCDGVAPRPSAS